MMDDDALDSSRRAARWPVLLGSGLFLLVGAGILWLSLGSLADQISFLHGAASTRGTVVATGTRQFRLMDYDNDIDDFYNYTSTAPYAKVDFQLPDGATVAFDHVYGLFENPLSKGDVLKVYYDPRNPKTAQVAGFVSLWGTSLAMLVLAAMFLGSGIALYAVFGRRPRAARAVDPETEMRILSLYEAGEKGEAVKLARRARGTDMTKAIFYVDELQRRHRGAD